MEDLRAKYSDFPQVVEYLDYVESDMTEHQEIFKPAEEAPQPAMPGLGALQAGEDFFGNYRVNDLVDNTACVGAPVVFEHSPT